MKKKKNALLVIGVSIALSLIIVFIVDKSFSIVGKLPSGVTIVHEYRSSGFGNGDSAYALKVAADQGQFLKFCQNVGVQIADERDRREIGYSPISVDLPDGEKIWWNEPDIPQLKSYLKEKRGFQRISYSKGFIYYFSRTW